MAGEGKALWWGSFVFVKICGNFHVLSRLRSGIRITAQVWFCCCCCLVCLVLFKIKTTITGKKTLKTQGKDGWVSIRDEWLNSGKWSKRSKVRPKVTWEDSLVGGVSAELGVALGYHCVLGSWSSYNFADSGAFSDLWMDIEEALLCCPQIFHTLKPRSQYHSSVFSSLFPLACFGQQEALWLWGNMLALSPVMSPINPGISPGQCPPACFNFTLAEQLRSRRVWVLIQGYPSLSSSICPASYRGSGERWGSQGCVLWKSHEPR